MDGFEVGERFDTMGLRANDLRRLYFRDVKVPPENVLGEPGEGFKIAMEILNNGRIGLGTGSVGGAKAILDQAIEHVTDAPPVRHDRSSEFELVQDKIGWMVSYLFGLESMAYLTCGLVDAGVEDYSLESAICKVAGHRVPLVRGQPRLPAARRRGLHEGQLAREDAARHPHLPDLRGRQRRHALVHRPDRAEARRREALGPRRDRPRRPDRLDRRPRRVLRRPPAARGPPRQDQPRATPSSRSTPRRSASRSPSCARSPRSCCARTARTSQSASSSKSACRRRSPTSSPRSRWSRG